MVLRSGNYKKLFKWYKKIVKDRMELLKHYFWLWSGKKERVVCLRGGGVGAHDELIILYNSMVIQSNK